MTTNSWQPVRSLNHTQTQETNSERERRQPGRPISGETYPVNVSSDGDVTVYFKSKGDGEECDAVIQF